MRTLRFRVPGSTTNLGHGFDCLGAALGCANVIGVTPIDTTQVIAPGAQDGGLVVMAERVREACGLAWGVAVPAFSVEVSGDVPIARGMGSSSTILVGVAAACQALVNRKLDPSELLPITAELEGHPDNVAAACFGGFTVVGQGEHGLRWTRFSAPEDLKAVVVIPPYEVKTSEARKILPGTVSKAELVRAIQRTALITAALAQGRAGDLAGLFAEAWHEGHRAALNPGLVPARIAAMSAGALGVILSGSGSTILGFSLTKNCEAVAQAMCDSFARTGVQVEVRILPFDNAGVVSLGSGS